MPHQVTVLYFGGLKEALGCAVDRVSLEEGQSGMSDLYERLCQRHGSLPILLTNVRIAVNEEFVEGVGQTLLRSDVVLKEGDVVAFIPPVTGG
jgi:molybdopterin converting factor subunit 1